VRLLLVGMSGNSEARPDEWEAQELTMECWPEESELRSGREEIAGLAADLRELDRALADGAFDAVLVGSDSSAALAAVIVATKLGIPVARLESARGAAEGANARLIAQLADSAIAPDAGAISEWVRDGYPARR
jgi:UDP-N-acetylglucosamine 2-epimerase